MEYSVIDLHCDVLMKLANNSSFDFFSNELDINYNKLKQGNVKVQAMAIFIDPNISSDKQFEEALKQIQAYKEKVLTTEGVIQITRWSQLQELTDNQIGTFLTLEGVDCIGNDLSKLEYLINQGVLSCGLTWNNANLACDGIMEQRGAGLSKFGKEVVILLNSRDILIDVSHISEKGFMDVVKLGKHVIASHSNSYSICGHTRNLRDYQIEELLKRDSIVHLVYCTAFVSDSPVTIDDLIKHVNYFIERGMENNIGLGSDFDGIKEKIVQLEDSSMTMNFISTLENKYGTETTKKICCDNFIAYIQRNFKG